MELVNISITADCVVVWGVTNDRHQSPTLILIYSVYIGTCKTISFWQTLSVIDSICVTLQIVSVHWVMACSASNAHEIGNRILHTNTILQINRFAAHSIFTFLLAWIIMLQLRDDFDTLKICVYVQLEPVYRRHARHLELQLFLNISFNQEYPCAIIKLGMKATRANILVAINFLALTMPLPFLSEGRVDTQTVSICCITSSQALHVCALIRLWLLL